MKKSFSFIILLICCTSICFAEGERPHSYLLTGKTRLSATARSACLPGWGQFFLRRNTRGYFISIAAVAGLLGGSYSAYRAQNTYDDYKAKGIPNDSLYDQYLQQRNFMYASFGVAALFWIYGIVDAYVATGKDVSDKFARKSSQNKGFVLSFYDEKDIIAYYVKF